MLALRLRHALCMLRGGAGHVGAEVREVPLRRRLHLAELPAERHHRAPQRQQPAVLRREVLVERLQGNDIRDYGMSLIKKT